MASSSLFLGLLCSLGYVTADLPKRALVAGRAPCRQVHSSRQASGIRAESRIFKRQFETGPVAGKPSRLPIPVGPVRCILTYMATKVHGVSLKAWWARQPITSGNKSWSDESVFQRPDSGLFLILTTYPMRFAPRISLLLVALADDHPVRVGEEVHTCETGRPRSLQCLKVDLAASAILIKCGSRCVSTFTWAANPRDRLGSAIETAWSACELGAFESEIRRDRRAAKTVAAAKARPQK